MKIAAMQPYYYPYAGYFRLFAATDLFVIYDCVQWNRRGRVHRYMANTGWITLPIKKTNRDFTRIVDMQWQDGKENSLSPADFVIASMGHICTTLDLPFNCARSSGMSIDSSVHGQDRIIAICKALGATEYVNSPGGRELYDERVFSDNGIRLSFLPEWRGDFRSVLIRLDEETPEEIRRDIYEQL